MGTLRYKYILYGYMEPLGKSSNDSGRGLYETDQKSTSTNAPSTVNMGGCQNYGPFWDTLDIGAVLQ